MTQTPDERVMPWTLEQRIAQWREQAAQCRADIEAGRTISPYPIEGAQYLQGREFAFDRCADESEAALRACAEAPVTKECPECKHPWHDSYCPVPTSPSEIAAFPHTCGCLAHEDRAEAPATDTEWRCFHCYEVFTDAAEAREHFGADMNRVPACRLSAEDVRQLRALEALNEKYRREIEEVENDAAMYHAQCHELERLFGKGVLSAHQAWLRWEEQESRAMAAEELLQAALNAVSAPPDPPHVREDYRDVWLSGWRAGALAVSAPPAQAPTDDENAVSRVTLLRIMLIFQGTICYGLASLLSVRNAFVVSRDPILLPPLTAAVGLLCFAAAVILGRNAAETKS